MTSKYIEDIIFTRGGKWEFDEHVSMIFDDHVRKSIPCYQAIQELIAQISKKLLDPGALVYDLGTATGEIIYNLNEANDNKDIHYIGIDRSLPMLKKAKNKCKNIGDAKFYNEKIETFNYEPSDLIVAAFTFQFIPIKERKPTLHKIKEALKSNGSFIFCEKITYQNQEKADFFVEIYEDWKLNHFSREEVEAKRESLKDVMQPLSLPQNIDLLNEAGFQELTVFFKWCNFVCILAR